MLDRLVLGVVIVAVIAFTVAAVYSDRQRNAAAHRILAAQQSCRDRGGLVALLDDGEWRCVGMRPEGE